MNVEILTKLTVVIHGVWLPRDSVAGTQAYRYKQRKRKLQRTLRGSHNTGGKREKVSQKTRVRWGGRTSECEQCCHCMKWGKHLYRLNVSPTFIYWNLTLNSDGIWRWGFLGVVRPWGWSPHDKISALLRRGQRARSFPFTGFYNKKLAICNREDGSHQSPTMLVPWSQTSSLQNHEKWISVVYKPSRLWCFVIAAQTN